MARYEGKDDKQRESTRASQGAQSPPGGTRRGSESEEIAQGPASGPRASGPGASGPGASGPILPERRGFPMWSGGGLSPWQAWGFRRIFEDFDRMFDEMRREVFGSSLYGGQLAQRGERAGFEWMPRLDVEDSGRELVILAELPGVDPKDVKIECTEDGLTISGERREERTEEQGSYRSYGRFFRQIPMPSGCEMNKADASFKNGLLRIRFPKTQPANLRRIPISTEGGERRGGAGPLSEDSPRAEGSQRPDTGPRPGGGRRAT
jgi:HSP20 family protein